MSKHVYRRAHDPDPSEESSSTQGIPGKVPVTARLAGRPQVIFRVASAEAARELAGAFGPRDGNGVAAESAAAIDRAASSSGQPLPAELRSRFESSLGADLSSVRVHTGEDSAAAAGAVGARAYAVGQDIHFGAGAYDPSSAFGIHLIAHEVAHTVQQSGATPRRQHKLEVSTPGDAAEAEADRAADAMVSGASATIAGSRATISAVSRSPDDKGELFDDVMRKEAEDALVAWERAGGAAIDRAGSWMLGNWMDYLGATSGNPQLGWGDSTIASLANNAAGNLLTHLGDGLIKRGSAAGAAATLGALVGKVPGILAADVKLFGGIVGFAIGTLVEAVAGMMFESITGKADPNDVAADLAAKTAKLISGKHQQVNGETAKSKRDLQAAVDIAREKLRGALSLEGVRAVRDQAAAAVGHLGGQDPGDRSLASKMIRDWTMEHAKGPRGPADDTNSGQWNAATRASFGRGDLYGRPEVFAYQCRGHWAEAGLVDPHSAEMIKDAESWVSGTEDVGINRWAGKGFAFSAATRPGDLLEFLRRSGAPVPQSNLADLERGGFQLSCMLSVNVHNQAINGLHGRSWVGTVREWSWFLTLPEREGVDAGISEWKHHFTTVP